jgi:4a-hydroxytetrahydrobiopterin dehydratase
VARLLDPDELARQLGELPGWSGDTRSISRTVAAPSFPSALAIVAEVGEVAEELDHHPDIDIRWRTLLFGLSTHSAGGVTQLDIELAHRIDAAATAHGAT